MTLKNLTTAIGKMAIDDRLINCAAAGNSIYEINGKNVDGYPMLFIAPTGRHTVKEYTTSYSISLFYIDRLLEDKSNSIDVYSSAIETLKNLVLKIKDIEGVLTVDDNYEIINFVEDEKMDDVLSGAYTEIRVETRNEYCPE